MHVDVNPGDRAEICRAPMRPAQLLFERGRFVIVHRCTGCGVVRRCRCHPDDDLSTMLD
jgi:hypothetical protein